MSERPLDGSSEPDEFVDAAAALAKRSHGSSSVHLKRPSSLSTSTTKMTTPTMMMPAPPPTGNYFLRCLRLGLASSYYTVSEALGLRRLGEIFKARRLMWFFVRWRKRERERNAKRKKRHVEKGKTHVFSFCSY